MAVNVGIGGVEQARLAASDEKLITKAVRKGTMRKVNRIFTLCRLVGVMAGYDFGRH